VTAPSPYTPPQSNVRDGAPSRHEKRVLRGLSKLLNDEERRARRNRVYRWAFAVAGVFCVGLAVLVGEADAANVVWAALLGALGGYLVAVSALLATANRNWPIIRRYLDRVRIQADYEAVRD